MRFLILCIFGVITFFESHISFWSEEVTIFSNSQWSSVTARKNIIASVVHSKDMRFTYRSLAIFIDGTLVEPRGRMRWKLITLSAKVLRDSEFLKLFVHELAHYMDIYIFVSQSGKDISNDFYAISWQSSTVKRAKESLGSFVTGYAASNQYEDFAESLVFYIFHNRIFEDRAMRNESLRQKYLFFQQNVFPGGAFTNSDFTIWRMPAYSWDSTKIPISLQKYLYSLE